jgi:hypothetical protein
LPGTDRFGAEAPAPNHGSRNTARAHRAREVPGF